MPMAFPGVCDVCQRQSGCQMAVVISTMRLDESVGLTGYNKSNAYILYNYYHQITPACPHLLIPLVILFASLCWLSTVLSVSPMSSLVLPSSSLTSPWIKPFQMKSCQQLFAVSASPLPFQNLSQNTKVTSESCIYLISKREELQETQKCQGLS